MNVRRRIGTRAGVLGLLAAGWLLGLAVQVRMRLETGYMDVYPLQILLGLALCLGAGAAARIIDPVKRTWKRGALAGMAMLGSIIAGYAILAVLMWNPAWSGQGGGETWFPFLVGTLFWIGVPLAVGAGLGGLGWVAADYKMDG